MFFARRIPLFGAVNVLIVGVLTFLSLKLGERLVSALTAPVSARVDIMAELMLGAVLAIGLGLAVLLYVLWLQEYVYFWKARAILLDIYVNSRAISGSEGGWGLSSPRYPMGVRGISEMHRRPGGVLVLETVVNEGSGPVLLRCTSNDYGLKVEVFPAGLSSVGGLSGDPVEPQQTYHTYAGSKRMLALLS